MKKLAIAMALCILSLWVLSLYAVAEDTAFDLGRLEGTAYVNADMGITFQAGGFSGMEQYYAEDALDETNGCAWNDAGAIQDKLEAGETLVCYVFADVSMRVAGAINGIRITVQNAREGAEDPELALLEESKADMETQAKEYGFNVEKAEMGEMDFAGSVRPCLSMDMKNNGRHKQMLFVTIPADERVYQIAFDMDASEVAGYTGHFSVR
ncbi:MAG: hypothetical protein ACOYI7_00710 [Candidatus Excrementavichristensenella sp.]|jgi:hypothetical protein